MCSAVKEFLKLKKNVTEFRSLKAMQPYYENYYVTLEKCVQLEELSVSFLRLLRQLNDLKLSHAWNYRFAI